MTLCINQLAAWSQVTYTHDPSLLTVLLMWLNLCSPNGYTISHTEVRILINNTSITLSVQKWSFCIIQYNFGLGRLCRRFLLECTYKGGFKNGVHFKVLRKTIQNLQYNDQLTHHFVWVCACVGALVPAFQGCRPMVSLLLHACASAATFTQHRHPNPGIKSLSWTRTTGMLWPTYGVCGLHFQ